MTQLAADGISVVVNPAGGMLDDLVITRGGRTVTPLHRAPWIDHPHEVPDGAPPHLRVLAGDFFCAPFGRADLETAPTHGWSANGLWSLESETGLEDARTATFRLDTPILGATLRKILTVRDGHPVVYQCHAFEGGEGALPVAHHAMIHVPGGARLSFSRKLFGATPDAPLESDPARGHSVLRYPQRFPALDAVRLADGQTVDATAYPFATGHEDFLTLFDPPGALVGWSAALAREDGVLVFGLKDARALPQTSLWMSNGGRRYPPWSSRHTAVLGLEETCTCFGDGHRRSAGPNPLTAEGLTTALGLDPNRTTQVRYALGAIPADPDWTEIASITIGPGHLVIRDVGGGSERVPFDDAFLA